MNLLWRSSYSTVLACVLAAGAASSTFAQVTTAPAPGSHQTIPEKQAAPLNSGRSDSLSGQLSRSGGVIVPKSDVDPAIKKPAPDPMPNSTPVIPPAATGGNSAK